MVQTMNATIEPAICLEQGSRKRERLPDRFGSNLPVSLVDFVGVEYGFSHRNVELPAELGFLHFVYYRHITPSEL